VTASRDHSDVTNSHPQPIYSSVRDPDDIRPHLRQPHHEPAAAAAASGLPKYVHETPI